MPALAHRRSGDVARRSKSQTLALWANGAYVGRWTITARGAMELQYDPAWRASTVGRPLSLSLPFGLGDEPLKGPFVEHYFDNLLPDSPAIRRRVAERFRTGSVEAFDLLGAVGRDCVGALQFLPEGTVPKGHDRVEGVEVNDEAIERHLLEVVTPDRFGAARDPDDDFRISLAGEGCVLAVERPLDEATRRDADHAHLQAAARTGGRATGRLQHLGGQRVAVPEAAGCLRPASAQG
jgi:HipA-like protein